MCFYFLYFKIFFYLYSGLIGVQNISFLYLLIIVFSKIDWFSLLDETSRVFGFKNAENILLSNLTVRKRIIKSATIVMLHSKY